MSSEEQGKVAWETHKKIIENEEMRRTLMFINMKHINELYSTKGYRAIFWKAPHTKTHGTPPAATRDAGTSAH